MDLKSLKESIKNGKAKDTEELVQKLLAQGADAEDILNQALIPAMDEVGELFQQGEYFVPELLVAARAMQKAMEAIRPKLIAKGVKSRGKVVLGTVRGDLHDIGKNLVKMMVEGAGFEVVDLGIDVTPEKFVQAVKDHQAGLIGMSALLTTTMLSMRDTVNLLKSEGVRNQVKVMVGGAPLRKEFADEIGADFYGKDATEAKNYAKFVYEE